MIYYLSILFSEKKVLQKHKIYFKLQYICLNLLSLQKGFWPRFGKCKYSSYL